ncbi:MAG: hypothetical protein WC055_15850 [Melioribacteraceae bacterium]
MSREKENTKEQHIQLIISSLRDLWQFLDLKEQQEVKLFVYKLQGFIKQEPPKNIKEMQEKLLEMAEDKKLQDDVEEIFPKN